MRKNKYLKDLAIQLLVIALVIASFRLIDDRKWASVWAGSLFVLTPLVLAYFEYRHAKWRQWVWWLGVSQFFLFFALPTFFGRALNWSEDFRDIFLLGLPLSHLHKLANISYLVMMATTLI